MSGGKEIHVRELSLAQSRRGDEVTLLFAQGDPVPGVDCRRVGRSGLWRRLPRNVASVVFAVLAAARILVDERCDVVHVHGDYLDLLPVGLAARLRRTRLVASVHGGLNMRHERLARLAYRLPHEIVCLGPTPRRQVEGLVRDPRRVHEMSSGLNAGLLDAAVARAQRADRTPHGIVSVGSLDPVKNFETSIRAVRRIADGRPGMLRIIGEGAHREALERTIDGDPAIRLLGSASRTEVYDEVLSGQVFLMMSRPLPGKAEGVPTALLEAMYLRRACVVSRSADPGWRAPDGSAPYLVVPETDEAGLAAGLLSLLADSASRVELGDRAHEAVKDRTWDNVAADVRDVLVGGIGR